MDDRPRLSRERVASLALEKNGALELPQPNMLGLPERLVQFGTGAFLRGFADCFIDEANRAGRFNGSIVAVASTASRRDSVLNGQDGLYTLAIQGMEGNAPRQRYRVIGSVSRALSARDEWDAVLAVARDPAVRIVVSNTSEVGIRLDDADRSDARPPKSYPAKLTRFLAERATSVDYDARHSIIVLPCELIERNGDALRAAVCAQTRRWQLDARFERWLGGAVTFCNTLVDRIVPGPLPPPELARLERIFGYRDGLATSCEPYALFAIEGDASLRDRLEFPGDDSRIVVAPDIRPYRERKVRVLNGAHTILVPAAMLCGLETVRDAVMNDRLGRFLRRAVFDEIVPSVGVPDAEPFARQVMERFANPYIRHALIDISLHGTAKLRVRVVPSILAYAERTRRPPAALAFGFAAYIAFMRGELQMERRAAGLPVPDDAEGERVRSAWLGIDPRSDASVAKLARAVSADSTLWGADLSSVAGFGDVVAEHLVRIVRHGIRPALDTHLAEPATT
ncbi:MAG: tagaturonate reductase [Gemmatimonadales bacterium]